MPGYEAGPANAVGLAAYRAPTWLPGGNLQTIWPALYAQRGFEKSLCYTRARWQTPDQDFIDVDQLQRNGLGATCRTLLVLFHGLEGSSGSHYAQAFAAYSHAVGFAFAVPHFRGCSGEINLSPRAYHSGDFEEIDWILRRFRREHHGPIIAVGVSLGGNALLRWAAEAGEQAATVVSAIASISAPIDLTAGGTAIGKGFNRLVYTRMFLRSMKPKALQKLLQFPGLFDRTAMLGVQSLYEFDSVFTAPVHGFLSTEDYWQRASAKPHLHRIRIPTLALNALNDPFVPASCLPQPHGVGDYVTLWQPKHGGHVGFATGLPPGHLQRLPEHVGRWLATFIQ